MTAPKVPSREDGCNCESEWGWASCPVHKPDAGRIIGWRKDGDTTVFECRMYSGDTTEYVKREDYDALKATIRTLLAEVVVWRPIEKPSGRAAPHDGQQVLLLTTDLDEPRTHGFWQEGVEEDGSDGYWNFAGWCWTHDRYCHGSTCKDEKPSCDCMADVHPVMWAPMPQTESFDIEAIERADPKLTEAAVENVREQNDRITCQCRTPVALGSSRLICANCGQVLP